jgi:hypothetical protein
VRPSDRPVLTTRGRLVDERGDDGPACDRCLSDGDLTPRQAGMRCCITPIVAANTPASSSSDSSRCRLLDEPTGQRRDNAAMGSFSLSDVRNWNDAFHEKSTDAME